MSSLPTMLKLIGNMGAKCEKFILDHGTEYTFRPLPKKYRAGPERYCFMNAARLALSSRELIYVEGFGSSEILCSIPALHAWCIDARGRVVDPTWTDPTSTYVGITISDELLMAEQMRTKHYGVLFEGGIKFNEKFATQWLKENKNKEKRHERKIQSG